MRGGEQENEIRLSRTKSTLLVDDIAPGGATKSACGGRVIPYIKHTLNGWGHNP